MDSIPKQTCPTCPHLQKCWSLATNAGKPVSTQNVLINILVCRLQLGIDRNKAAENLLQLFRPGMVRLLSHAKQQGDTYGMDMDQFLQDMRSTAIEYLLYDYKIGDRGRATPYLFDPHQGFLTKWVKWVTGKNRRFYIHHELVDPSDTYHPDEDSSYGEHNNLSGVVSGAGASWDSIMEGSDSHKYDPHVSEDNTSDMVREVTEIIDDGVTLNSNEYRVIKFCMTNGNEANSTRHIDGLHIYLAKLMGVSRPRITRLYKRAKDKIKKKYATTVGGQDD